jgi:hypothetical protein
MPPPRTDRRRRTALAAAAPWALLAGLRITGAERGLPLVPAVAFTPQAAMTSVLPLALALARRSRAAALVAAGSGVALAACARSGARVEAVLPGGPVRDRLRVATVSMLRGEVPADAVVDHVRRHDVDVLSVSELSPPSDQRLREAGLERLLPHAHLLLAGPEAKPAGSGGLWSRRPLTACSAVSGTWLQPTARVSTAAGEVEVTAVHAKAPLWSPSGVRDWTTDLAALPAPEPGVLRVLAGDFNATPDHAAFRAVLARGYRDAAAARGRGRTWTWAPLTVGRPRLTLDHVLVDPRIAVASVEIVRVRGSDHRSVVADLDLR